VAWGGSSLKGFLTAPRGVRITIVAIVILSLAIRLVWVFGVQRPGDAVYSDMLGYMLRAQALIAGDQNMDDEYNVCYPYGTHYLYALESLVFGDSNYEAMGAAAAILSASVTLFLMLAALRCFSTVWPAYALGLVSALWYPQVSYAGFLTSETPYMFFLFLSLWLWIRLAQTGKGGGWAGLATALGFTIRPQLVMTALMGVAWMMVRKRDLDWFRWRTLAVVLLPALVVIGYSAYRHQDYTGHLALISDNDAVGRFFASTKYKRILAARTRPDGTVMKRSDGTDVTRKFQPPATRQLGYTREFTFTGYIADAKQLGAERARYQSTLSLAEKLGLLRRNIALVAFMNTMWPERNHAKEGTWRGSVFDLWAWLVKYMLLPLSFLGLLSLAFRRNLALELASLHIATMVYSAAVYFAEIRYRVPYDLILVLFAVQAIVVGFRLEPRGAPQDRWMKILISAVLGLFAVLVLVPWGPMP